MAKATASGARMSTGDFFSTGRRRAEGLAVMETVEADIESGCGRVSGGKMETLGLDEGRESQSNGNPRLG